jgi:fucose permease
VFVAIFIGLGFWWGLPVMSATLLTLLLALSLRLPLRADAHAPASGRRSGIPSRFWVFAAFAVLYGICETVNGNWSQLDMTRELGASTTLAAFALTAFWAMVTVGRIGSAALGRRMSAQVIYRVLPLLLAAAFVLIAMLGEGDGGFGVVAFGLAGLGCSALLPLTISFGQEQLAAISAAMAGGVIAFYQVGYGIAAFGVGPLVDGGVELSTVYAVSAGIAVLLGLLAVAVTRPRLTRSERVDARAVAARR